MNLSRRRWALFGLLLMVGGAGLWWLGGGLMGWRAPLDHSQVEDPENGLSQALAPKTPQAAGGAPALEEPTERALASASEAASSAAPEPIRWRVVDTYGAAVIDSEFAVQYRAQLGEQEASVFADDAGWVTLPLDVTHESHRFLDFRSKDARFSVEVIGQRRLEPFDPNALVRRCELGRLELQVTSTDEEATREPFLLAAFAYDGEDFGLRPSSVSELAKTGSATLELPEGLYQVAACFPQSPWLVVATQYGTPLRVWVPAGAQVWVTIQAPTFTHQVYQILEPLFDPTGASRTLGTQALVPYGVPEGLQALAWNTDAHGAGTLRTVNEGTGPPQDVPKFAQERTWKSRASLLRCSGGLRDGELVLFEGTIGLTLQRPVDRSVLRMGVLLGRGGETYLHSEWSGHMWALDPDLPWEKGRESNPPIRIQQPDNLRVQSRYPSGDWSRAEAQLQSPLAMDSVELKSLEVKLERQGPESPLEKPAWSYELRAPEAGLGLLKIELAGSETGIFQIPVLPPPHHADVRLTWGREPQVGKLGLGELTLVQAPDAWLATGKARRVRVRCVDTQGKPVPFAAIAGKDSHNAGIRTAIADEQGGVDLFLLGPNEGRIGALELPSMGWSQFIEPLSSSEERSLDLVVPRQALSLNLLITGHPTPDRIAVQLKAHWPNVGAWPQFSRTEVSLQTNANAEGMAHFDHLLPSTVHLTATDTTGQAQPQAIVVQVPADGLAGPVYIDMDLGAF